MSDPARVYARKYADLESEVERYRAALETIAEDDDAAGRVARLALDGQAPPTGPAQPDLFGGEA